MTEAPRDPARRRGAGKHAAPRRRNRSRPPPPGRHRWPALAVVLLAAFMDLVDVTIVNVALPRIHDDLGGSRSAGQWVVAGYALAFALTLVTGGRLGDIAGRQKIFLIGVLGFTAASAAAGAAVSPGMLVAARVAQGVFGGIMVPQVMSVITTQFPVGRARTTALSLSGLVLGLATVSGPLLGGLLTSVDAFGLGWRLVFYVNVPVGLIALAGGALWLRESRSEQPARLDLPGVFLLAAASLLLLGPLLQGRELHWPWWLLAALAMSLPVTALFVRHERRRERSGGSPLVPPRLFGERSFTRGTVLSTALNSSTTCYYLALTWALQSGLGWSPLRLGLTLLAWPLGIACTGQFTNWYGHRAARLFVGVGSSVMIPGLLGLVFALHWHGTGLRSADIVPWLFLSGIGMGMIAPVLPHVTLRNVPAALAGAASGVLNSANQMGAAMGAAVTATIFFAGAPVSPADHLRAAERTLLYSFAILAVTAGVSLVPRYRRRR
ncbi:MFS transporter [Actinomadura alba]|uniref:MFS transporter n=1 Tax=Actinomadura alba TaxID=406431 RepID=A0ABR7LY26_9ACTN|nr:MFS transporter [Actinomadura alba]MBC6469760.1 MFS transporter [Actinomadura alba]